MRFASISKFVVALLPLAAMSVSSAASADAESVALRSAFFGNLSYHGCESKSASFDVVTTAFGHDKSVFVRLKESDGSWTDLPATLRETLADGHEIWTASASYGKGACPTVREAPAQLEFVVGVKSPKGELFDSNGGANYIAAAGSGAYLGNAIVAKEFATISSNSANGRTLLVSAFVKNVAYAKSVDVVYSTDGWKTVSTLPLAFTPNYSFGYGSYQSPNANGAERWLSESAKIDQNCADFAIRYRAEGIETWDNNLGNNYHVCATP